MKSIFIRPETDFGIKLKRLMFFRVFFTTLLLGSTLLLQWGQIGYPPAIPLLVLYGLIIAIFGLSIGYACILSHVKREHLFAGIQVGNDTFIVTLIVFLTGTTTSLFSFLYLVVIIYSSLFLFRRGILLMACACSIQYNLLLGLDYYGILKPFCAAGVFAGESYDAGHILYKMVVTTVAFFAVAFLSSLLSEQTRKTKRKLLAMEDHVKRVEKVAAIGEMAAGLAHEIKNPLASITGSIQLLREDMHCDPELDKLMQIVLREADRLNSLVTNFLLFAKPPAGRVEPLELGKALAETVTLFEKDRNCRGRIEIATEFCSGIWIKMDPVHLRQIFWNLLLNAAEAIETMGRIDVKMYPLKNKYACVHIADTGCGISEEIVQSIFDPFFTTKPNGTGLGLSIVHRILEYYGSRLDLETRRNAGTIFMMKLKRISMPTLS